MFCIDCDELLQTVLYERGKLPLDAEVHCGFDNGQAILKIAISVLDKTEEKGDQKRSKYSEVLTY